MRAWATSTPEAAARAILNYRRGEPNFCEWYIHLGGFNHEKVLQVGHDVVQRAFQHRHHHTGFMSHFPLARALVERVRRGASGPQFMSW